MTETEWNYFFEEHLFQALFLSSDHYIPLWPGVVVILQVYSARMDKNDYLVFTDIRSCHSLQVPLQKKIRKNVCPTFR